jgi:hypothetical protein
MLNLIKGFFQHPLSAGGYLFIYFAVVGLELRAFTLSYSTNLFL